MAVTVELKLDTDTLREQMREIIAEMCEGLVCLCQKRQPYVDYIDEVHIHQGTYDIREVFAANDRIWSNR